MSTSKTCINCGKKIDSEKDYCDECITEIEIKNKSAQMEM